MRLFIICEPRLHLHLQQCTVSTKTLRRSDRLYIVEMRITFETSDPCMSRNVGVSAPLDTDAD